MHSFLSSTPSSSASSPLISDLPPLYKVTHHSIVALPRNILCWAKTLSELRTMQPVFYPHFLLSHFYVLIMVHCHSSLCDTELGKQSAGCATWCRGVGQSTCWGKDSIQVYRWRTDRLLAGVAASLPVTDSIFITHLSLRHHWRKPQMVAFVQRSPEESS